MTVEHAKGGGGRSGLSAEEHRQMGRVLEAWLNLSDAQRGGTLDPYEYAEQILGARLSSAQRKILIGQLETAESLREVAKGTGKRSEKK